MRILVCADQSPRAPMNGGRQLLASVLRELAPRHDIRVLALRWKDQTGDAPDGITLDELPAPGQSRLARLAGFIRGVLTREPYEPPRIARAMRPSLVRAVEEHDPDVVHLSALTLAGLASAVRGRPALITPIDAWHLNSEAAEQGATGARRIALRIESANARRYSASAYRPFDRTVYVTREDADEAEELDPLLRTAVVPYGLDVDAYSFGTEPRDRDLLVFTGAMHWAPNVDAARVLVNEVLPLVRRRRPAARVAIVGRWPAALVAVLAETPGVVVTGEVPDVRPWLWRAGVFVCPMEGGTGVKTKLLEAFACGAPAVATRLATQGMSPRPGEDFVLADGAEAIAAGAELLLGDEEERDRVARSARRYVEEHHSWGATARAFEALYDEIRHEHGSSSR
jgi:polysaccharide biosynthesis protein PslH